MTTTFLLIRHAAHGHLGHTLSGRASGIPLSEAGMAQAARLAARLAGEGVALVQTSPIARAVATAEAIAKATGCAVEEVEALIEIDFGDWTGRSFVELDGDPAWVRWNAERGTARVPGGESMAEAQGRIVGHLRDVARRFDGRTIAIVTHCDMIRAAVADAIGLPLDRLLRFEVDAASVTRLTVEDGAARLLGLNERMD